MRRLGLSVYIGNAELSEYKDYLQRAAKYGFSRIFTCLISVDDMDKALQDLQELCSEANSLSMDVVVDVTPAIFSKLGASVHNLKPFHDLGLKGIRLDLGFTGLEESIMSYNEYGLKIEINMSNGTRYIDTIFSYEANKDNIIGCHNFYPHRYTGLSRQHFEKCSRQFKEYGLTTAAFVSSPSATFGAWPVNEGLCTLEEHRELPPDVQTKDLFNSNLIDDVIIANCFATEEELKRLGELDRYLLSLKVELHENIPQLAKKIVLEEPHFCRGDMSAYMIRSTQSRVKYKDSEFPLFNAPPIKKGDVLIESSLYKRYAGELQIALQDMENSGRTNVVGSVCSEEIYLLDQIQPWQKFKFEL